MDLKGIERMRRTTFAIAALLLLAAAPVMAEEPGPVTLSPEQMAQVPPDQTAQMPPPELGYNWTGPYIGVNGGYGWGRTGWTYLPPPGAAPHNTSGGLVGGTVGYNWQFDPSWVVGAEADYDWADMSGSASCPNPTFACRSKLDNFGTARIRLGWTADRLMLFGTGGAAWTQMKVQTVNLAGGAVAPSGTTTNGTTDTRFGWTAGAGVEYALYDQLSMKIEGLYYDFGSHDFNVDNGLVVRANNHGEMVRAGFNWNFGGIAPPPPVVAPAAVPAPPPVTRKVFLVFFDWDRDTITPKGQEILEQAAAAYKSGAPVRIMVTGYTDRSGSPGYNQRLSERRANNVANALGALGVPRDQMAVSGRGENDNRVPTAPGVREPQNRRVEIVFP
jgi:outer membrane immunogenic protein